MNWKPIVSYFKLVYILKRKRAPSWTLGDSAERSKWKKVNGAKCRKCRIPTLVKSAHISATWFLFFEGGGGSLIWSQPCVRLPAFNQTQSSTMAKIIVMIISITQATPFQISTNVSLAKTSVVTAHVPIPKAPTDVNVTKVLGWTAEDSVEVRF